MYWIGPARLAATVETPMNEGEIVLFNLMNMGIDVIATRHVEKIVH